jgi:hypothetical protein
MTMKHMLSQTIVTMALVIGPAPAGIAQSAASPSQAVQEIIAAERAFAADTRARGAGLSFRAAAAADAIAIRPHPEHGVFTVISVRERFQTAPSTPRPSTIQWWPIFAGAAASGDLGFTTGPVNFPNGRFGYIFTVWARQADGAWRYYFDGGPNVDEAPTTTPHSPVAILPRLRFSAVSAAAAEAEVRQIEDNLHRASLIHSRQAFEPYLTESTRLMGSGIVPTIGRRAAMRELERRASSVEFAPLGMRAARSGDVVFSYGRARAGSANGGYTRIWQRQRAGWRLVIDQLQFPPPGPAS